ncbi:unnamed protein product [Trichobilharzia regenti]|nr:unnamed protein product [Trichobilharzia regenti]
MPYFPGRSACSLQSRFKTLRKWAKLWSDLRNRIPVVPQDSTGGCNSLSPSQESILIYSPLAKHFVNQLRNAGVADPETEAYRTVSYYLSTQYQCLISVITVNLKYCQINFMLYCIYELITD